MPTLSISDNGRVLIPADMREQLGLKPKGRLHAEIKDGALILKPMSQHFMEMRAYLDSVLKIDESRSLSDELIAERRAEAAKENGQDAQ